MNYIFKAHAQKSTKLQCSFVFPLHGRNRVETKNFDFHNHAQTGDGNLKMKHNGKTLQNLFDIFREVWLIFLHEH